VSDRIWGVVVAVIVLATGIGGFAVVRTINRNPALASV
jgi:hypothetical protein